MSECKIPSFFDPAESYRAKHVRYQGLRGNQPIEGAMGLYPVETFILVTRQIRGDDDRPSLCQRPYVLKCPHQVADMSHERTEDDPVEPSEGRVHRIANIRPMQLHIACKSLVQITKVFVIGDRYVHAVILDTAAGIPVFDSRQFGGNDR